jgi:hypothetical protein
MWPWKRTGPSLDEFRTLESEVRRLRAEWNDMFERLVRKDDRIRKAQEREKEAHPPSDTREGLKAALRARAFAQRGTNGTSP